MISCNDAHETFSAYWEEDLSAARRERLETHWATCEACRSEYETFAAAMRAVRALPRLEAPDLTSRVLARVRDIEAARPASWWSPGRLFDWAAWRADWSWRPALAAAAAVVAVVAGVAIVQQGLVDRTQQRLQSPVATVDGSRESETPQPAAAGTDRITAAESEPDDRLATALPRSASPAVEPPDSEPGGATSPGDAGSQQLLAGPSPAAGGATSFLDSLLLHNSDVEYALDRIQLHTVPGDSGLTPMPAMPGAPEGKPASLTF